MAQEDIRIENTLYLYTHLTSGLANGEDVITDTTLIYDKILKMRLEDVNKLLYDRPTKLNLQNRTLVTLYKLTNYNSTIVLSEYERSSSIEILRGNGWQESPFFTERGDIFSTTAFYDELFNIIELSDGFYWSLAKYFFRNTTKIDVIDQKQLYIYVKNCEETPNTPSGGHYDFDEDILYDVIWKNKAGDNLDWSLEIEKGDIYVWQSSCIAYNDGSDLKWSNPIRIILNLGELLNLLKGTSLLSITLYTNSETKPNIDSIKNVFINPRIIKENPKKNPYVLIVGGEEVDWNDEDGIWKLDLPTEGKIWITNRICSYDFDTEVLTGTEWSEPRLFMNIDEIINNILEEIEDAKDLAIENTQSQINSLKDEADNIVRNMNDASLELDTLKNNYEQNIKDAILYKKELDEINNEYFGEGGIVDREVENLSTLIPNKDLIILELSKKGNLFSPYSVSEILSVNTNLNNIYVIGNPSLIPDNNIDSGKLTYLLNDTDNNTILITQGKSYQDNNFINTSELEGKKNIIVKGNYDNTTKSIIDSYIIEQDSIYAKLNEYKEYTNGILSSWGLTGEGVLIEGEESKYTTLQAITDALNGKIISEIQNVKDNLDSNYVNKTYLELTAENIKASVSYSEFITVDTVEITGKLKAIISIPDSNDLYIYLKYKEEKEGALDGIHIKYCTAKNITDVNEVSIDNEKISYQFKINRSDIPNDHNLLIIENCDSNIIEVTVRYSIDEALTGLKIDKDGIEANVANRILKDEETINKIASSIFTSDVFETKFNEATTIDGLTVSNKFAELNLSVEGIKGKIGKITDNEGNLKLDLSFINLTNNKINSSVMEANIIYDESLTIDLIEDNKENLKTITLPVRKYIKVSDNSEENTYYNSPYYIIYNGGTIQIETDNIDLISGSHIYEDILSGSTIELTDVSQTISLKVKNFSKENTEKKIQVKFGYNSTTAMSLLILTSEYIANTIYGKNGFSGLQLTVNSISSEIYNKDEGGQSNFTLLKLSIGEIKTIVTNEEEGKEGLVLKFSDIKETVDEINLRTVDLNYSDYKNIKLTKGEDSGPISLNFKNCSYKITFDPIKVNKIGYTKSNIARVLEGYTIIENGEIIEITDEENISFKYEDDPNELDIKPDKLDVKISVLTSAMIANLNITPESIVLSVTLAITGKEGDSDIQSAMISLTTNNISSIINKGNASTAIIQSINNDTSLTLISSDRIILDGDIIAKAISSKSLNIDNLTYIFGKNDQNRELTNLIAEHNFTNTDPYNIQLIKNSKYEILFTFENIEPESKISITKIKEGENVIEDISIDSLKKNINIDKDCFDNGYTSIEISVNQNCSMQIFETTSIIDDIATKGPLTGSRYPLLYIGAGTTGLSNFRSDGSGYLAGGAISWDRYKFDENGNISIDTDGSKIIEENANFTLDINGIIHAKAGLIGAWTISSLINNSDGGYLYSKDNNGNIMQINAKNGIISFSEKSNKEGEGNRSTINPSYNFNIGVDGNVMFSKGNIKFNADGSCILGDNKKSCIEIGADGNVNISTAMNIGIYADNAVTYLSNGTAGFVSSTLEKYICSKETYDFFKNKTVKAGEGYLANGNIYWNEDGDLTISGSFELLSSSNEFGNNVVSVMHRMSNLSDFHSCLGESYLNIIIGIHSLYNMTTISKDNYNDIDLVKSISYLNDGNNYSYENFCYGTIFNYDINFRWDGLLLKNYNEEIRDPGKPIHLKEGQENPYTKQYESLPYIYIKDNGGGSNIVGHFFIDFDLLTELEYKYNDNNAKLHKDNLEILYNMIFYYKWLGLNPHEIYFPAIRIVNLIGSYDHWNINNKILTSKGESKYLKDIFLNYFFNEQNKYHKSIKLKDPKKYYGKIMEFELTMELELASTYIYYMLLASHLLIEYSSLYLPYIGFEDDVPDSKRIVSLNSLYKTISYENLNNIESHFCFIDSGIYNKYQPINPYIEYEDTGDKKYRPNYSTSIRLCLTIDAILKLAAGGSIKIKASAKKSSGRLLKEEVKDNANISGQLKTYIQEFYYWELSSDLLFYSDPNVIYYQSETEFMNELSIFDENVNGVNHGLRNCNKIKDIDAYGGKNNFIEACINSPYIYRKYLIENETELSKIADFETTYFNNTDQIRKMLNESYLIQTSFDIVDTIFKNRYHCMHPDNIIKHNYDIGYEIKKDATDERIIDTSYVSDDISPTLLGKFIYLLQLTEEGLPTELIAKYKPKEILPDIFNASGTLASQYVWNNINYKILKIIFTNEDKSNDILYIQYIPLSEFHCKKYENVGPVGGYWVYSNNSAYMLITSSDMNDNYNGFYFKEVQDYYLYA